MSQAAITLAFEQWKAQESVDGKLIVLDEFVFANVPDLDTDKPVDREETLPENKHIVHRQPVNKTGVVNENAVAYSVTLGANTGDFDFNWIGLINKQSNTLAMIVHAPLQSKIKNQDGQQGNVLTRSFLLEYNGAAKETAINTPAEMWQIDFTARLSGMDEQQRLINLDTYGTAAFFGDSFLVKKATQFSVTQGVAYIGGLRAQLTANKTINVPAKATKVWADVSWQGDLLSQWQSKVTFKVAENHQDYLDDAGFAHYVFAIASIDENGIITDLRPKGSLSEQQLIDELEKQKLYFDELIKAHEKSRNHPNASLIEKGFVKLNSATDSDSEDEAATPKAVKELKALVLKESIDVIYPVGVVMFFAKNKNPNTLFAGTEWAYIGENKTIRLANKDGTNLLVTGGYDAISITKSHLPNETISFTGATNSTGDHAHSRGTMEITGQVQGQALWDANSATASGAFVVDPSYKNKSTSLGGGGFPQRLKIKASGGWTGETSRGGAHAHTVSGRTEALGQGTKINVTNAFVMLMGWYRVS